MQSPGNPNEVSTALGREINPSQCSVVWRVTLLSRHYSSENANNPNQGLALGLLLRAISHLGFPHAKAWQGHPRECCLPLGGCTGTFLPTLHLCLGAGMLTMGEEEVTARPGSDSSQLLLLTHSSASRPSCPPQAAWHPLPAPACLSMEGVESMHLGAHSQSSREPLLLASSAAEEQMRSQALCSLGCPSFLG